MEDDAVENTLVRKLGECVAGKSLPKGFNGRLLLSVRRFRRRLMIETIVVIASALALTFVAIGFVRERRVNSHARETLIAERRSESGENVSKWAVFGIFRECFRRNRANRRKEDEK